MSRAMGCRGAGRYSAAPVALGMLAVAGCTSRVTLDHVQWVSGDAETFGPTTSQGEFRIDGGGWTPIPDTVTVPGPATMVTGRTARAQLVQTGG